jgi:hypothetical protein
MPDKKKSLQDLNQSATMEKGSGSDRNSDQRRLQNEDNLIDKSVEDTFPASDPVSQTGARGSQGIRGDHQESSSDDSGLPADFKDNKAAQFEYGRKSQASTQHFDTSTHRLEMGNPDVGNVDLGTIEADKPAQKDDDDLFDSADDDTTAEDLLNPEDLGHAEGSDATDKAGRMADRSERRADVDRQDAY